MKRITGKKSIAVVMVLLMVGLLASSVRANSIVWSGWSGEEESTEPTIQRMVDTWNQANPSNPVSWVGWPWANTLEQLIIRSQGNQAMDVAQVDLGMFATLSSMDVLLDLNEVFGRTWLEDNLEEAALLAGEVDGKQLAIPWTLASIGTVYNPHLLKAVGVSAPPTTISEFEDVLLKLKEFDNRIIPYALSTKDSTTASDFQPWVWAFGGSYFDEDGNITINSPEAIQALTWIKSLLDKGYIVMDMSRFDARQLYAQNLVGFYNDAIMARGILESNGVAADELDSYIMPMQRPVLKEGDIPQSTLWGHLLVVFQKTQNPELTAEFAKHVISEEQSLLYFEEVGMLPVMLSALDNDLVQTDKWASEWSEITRYGKLTETTLYANVNELNTIITEEVQAALTGRKTPQKALDDAATRMRLSL